MRRAGAAFLLCAVVGFVAMLLIFVIIAIAVPK